MDIRCPSCSKLFRVADEKIAGKGIRFKCSKCAEVITITKDDFEMDLLARDAEAATPQAAPAALAAPAAQPVIAPPPPQPTAPAPEPEAKEYKPPQDQPAEDQAIPPSSLGDFDFSEPHAAAAASAHPDDGFASGGISFDAGPEQQAQEPETGSAPAAAEEAEAALQFPADLISEPKRKPTFSTDSTEGQEPGAPEPEGGTAEEELDLGAALAIPKEPVTASAPVSAAATAAPKGPVITPELLAELKRNAQQRSAGQAKPASSAVDDMDLGAALAMPKTIASRGSEKAGERVLSSASTSGGGASSTRRTLLVFGGVALLLVIVAALALLSLSYLGEQSKQSAKQQPQQASQPQPVRKEVTAEGLAVVSPAAYIDPQRGDIIVSGKIQNDLDAPKAGWLLVIEIRDAKEAALTTVKMLNGAQVYTARDREILAKRGAKPEDIKTKAASHSGTIPGRGSVSFEVRVLEPPAGSARFLPMLVAFDPSAAGDVREK